jgi:hypothetical protein
MRSGSRMLHSASLVIRYRDCLTGIGLAADKETRWGRMAQASMALADKTTAPELVCFWTKTNKLLTSQKNLN